MPSPYFSIITPMYNRATMIGRAIESCLSQSFSDWELLIVDDASSDDSVEIASSYHDSRIRIFRHSDNRGPCPTRNTAIVQAQGPWCVMLDSDKALLPGALENLWIRTQTVAPEIGNVASSCLWDTGEITPLPSVPDEPLDFAGYLRWSRVWTVSEYFNCIRSEVFKDVRYPDSRAWELEFHVNLARRWNVHISRDVIVKVFTDAPNRLTAMTGAKAISRVLADASDKLGSFEAVLANHGQVIHQCSPEYYLYFLARIGHQAFLCGDRRKGIYYTCQVLRQRPGERVLWALMGLGLLGSRVTAWATVLRRK